MSEGTAENKRQDHLLLAESPQIIYLDFDGAETHYINAALDLDLAVSVTDSGLTGAQKQTVINELTEKYRLSNLIFTLEQPDDHAEYSTVFIGQSSGPDPYTSAFAGIAENIDRGNRIKNDNAFVFADRTYDLRQLISVVDHELRHIVGGETHSVQTGTLEDYAYTTGILMSTLWSQSGRVNTPGNTSIDYNQYCPIDPTTGRKTLTGCTNTAASQIIYYHIEKMGLDLQLTLVSSDAYTSSFDGVVINVKADGSTPGTVSFAQINAKLANFDLNSADDIAALNYACGVIGKAGYTSEATGTSWGTEVFYRSGFNCAVSAPMWAEIFRKKYWYWAQPGNWDFRISPEAYEVLIENLNAGLPIAVEYPGHALVMDGYNSDNDTFHVNYGWGNHHATGWYTREQIFQTQFNNFYYDLRSDASVNLSVTDGDVYGSNTFIRAWEQAIGTKGENTITFDDSLDGTDQVWQNYLCAWDTTTVNNMNIDVMVVDSSNDWAFGFWAEGKEGRVTFNDFSGSLIVNTAKSSSAVFCWNDLVELDFSGALIYTGNYSRYNSYSRGAEYVLAQLENWQTSGISVSADILEKINGSLLLANDSDHSLTHTVNIRDCSFVAGALQADQAIVVNIDSTSTFYTDVYSRGVSFNIDLTSPAAASPIITIVNYANNFSYHAPVITVNVSEEASGTYTLIGTMAKTLHVDQLPSLNIRVRREGKTTETLNFANGSTSTSDNQVTLISRGGELQLQVEQSEAARGSSVKVYSSGALVSSAGVMTGARLQGGGNNSMFVSSGGTAKKTSVGSGGMMYVSHGGSASSTTVSSGGLMYIASGGTIHSTTVGNRGSMSIFGTATAINNQNGGYVAIESGAAVERLTVSSGASLKITAASNTNVSGTYGNSAFRMENGRLSGFSAGSGTRLDAARGGWFADTVIMNSAQLHILNGGSAGGTIIHSGGTLHISSGAVHQGSLTISNGARVIADFGSEIEFDLTGRTINDSWLISNAALISGTPNYTITVSRLQANGSYKLAQGAAQFKGTITVEDNRGSSIGTLTVNGSPLQHNGKDYALVVSNGNMTLDITNNAAGGSSVLLYSSGTLVFSGTVLSGATIAEGGDDFLLISSGGSACDTIILSSGFVTVTSGGVVNNTSVMNGHLSLSGGSANSTFLDSDGSLTVSNGGVANNTILADALLSVLDGGTLNVVRVGSEGYLSVSSGGKVNGANICQDGGIYVFDKGVVESSNVSSGGSLYISRGGRADSVTIGQGGKMYITDEAAAENITAGNGGDIHITSGTMSRSTVSSGGNVYVSSGGTVDQITVSSGGSLTCSGSSISGEITIKKGGNLGGLSFASDKTFSLINGSALISEGVSVNNRTMRVSSGGTADKVTLNPRGSMFIYSGGAAVDTLLNQNTRIYVSSGGTMTRTSIKGGSLNVSAGAFVDSVTVDQLGSIFISSGGTAAAIRENGGFVGSAQGASITFISTTLTDLTLYSAATIHSCTVGSRLSIESRGRLQIHNGGSAYMTVVYDGAALYISSGGLLRDTLLSSGALMRIYSGGRHEGELTIGSGATVSAYTGGIVDFTLSDRSAGNDHLINDLSLIAGAPEYTITVSDTQGYGTYKLAGGAGSFSGSLSIGNGQEIYGTLTVNGNELCYGESSYSLDLSDGDLTLTISEHAAAPIRKLRGDSSGVSWEAAPENSGPFTVEYSTDGFAGALSFETGTNQVDTFAMPSGTCQWRVKSSESGFVNGSDIIVQRESAEPQQLISDGDGDMDIFFANASGVWGSFHAALRFGMNNGFLDTSEQAELAGKNVIADLFTGSADANILVLNDDTNGDALFIDDIYTALGNQARLAQIDEIRAGAGDDLVDMTSLRYSFSGSSIRICGGDGDDIIWGGAANNIIFGDRGNDRLVGNTGNDIFSGGSGDDSIHGGGGDDLFCFGENWGNDTVEQYAGSKVTLWFARGSESCWESKTLTYSDGACSVSVKGVAAEDITLVFGNEHAAPDGLFLDAVSGKIFETER